MKAKSILSSFFIIGSLLAVFPSPAHCEQKTDYAEQKKQLPPAILAFQKMDFDSRMIQQEFLRLKSGKTLFMDTIYQFLSSNAYEGWDERVGQSLALVYLGRPAETLDPKQSLADATRACGLKRLSQFIQFYETKPKPDSHFLDGKDAFYRTALSAEMHAFDEAGYLFSVDDIITYKKHLMAEERRFDTQHPFVGNPYRAYISEQAHKRLAQLQKARSDREY